MFLILRGLVCIVVAVIFATFHLFLECLSKFSVERLDCLILAQIILINHVVIVSLSQTIIFLGHIDAVSVEAEDVFDGVIKEAMCVTLCKPSCSFR